MTEPTQPGPFGIFDGTITIASEAIDADTRRALSPAQLEIVDKNRGRVVSVVVRGEVDIHGLAYALGGAVQSFIRKLADDMGYPLEQVSRTALPLILERLAYYSANGERIAASGVQ